MVRHLRLMILKVLSDKAHSGYELVKSIEEKTGWKPSYGSIYPALEELKKDGFLAVKEEGRKKIYSLKEKGKEKLKDWDEKKDEFHKNMKENIMVMCEMTGEDPGLLMQVMERMHSENDPFVKIMPEIKTYRETMFKMALDGRLEKHLTKIRQMLKEDIKKMKGMK